MTTMMINGLSVLMLLFFAAMALYPLFLSDRTSERTSMHAEEDLVLHISPAPMTERRVPVATHQPVALDHAHRDDSPSRREAA